MTSYSEHVGELSIVGSAATVYLNVANTFICDATADVSQFNLVNIPSFMVRENSEKMIDIAV